HPGILDFSQHAKAFETFEIGAVAITPIPLNHSKPTLGYLFEADGRRIAYLTDTCGLPEESEAFLKLRDLNLLVLDCSFPPRDEVRNHNDLTRALAIHETLGPGRSVLTHATDELDAWLMQHPESLPEDVECGRDGVLLAD
ncbi:MAG: MBL fold metallo-hydrolase, partial [Gammaproteobacteria bacterium]